MDKDIRDYYFYYIGQYCIYEGMVNPRKMTGSWMQSLIDKGITVKPILRKLESMTEEEGKEFVNIGVLDNGRKFRDITKYAVHFFDRRSYGAIEFSTLHPQHFHYLLSRGFWVFGDDWFDEGLIIDKATIKS